MKRLDFIKSLGSLAGAACIMPFVPKGKKEGNPEYYGRFTMVDANGNNKTGIVIKGWDGKNRLIWVNGDVDMHIMTEIDDYDTNLCL